MANPSLRQQLALLYQLQERDRELLSIHKRLQEIPPYIQELETAAAKYKKDIAVTSAELAESEKVQRSKNAEIEMNAQQREKYRTEQREVKSNEAYRALENQIDFLNLKDAEAEDLILEAMEDSDRLKAALDKLEAEANRIHKENEQKKASLEAERKTIEAQLTQKLKERREFLPKIEERFSNQYHRWVDLQKTDFVALGLVTETEAICGSCRIAIQPQTVKDAQKYEKFVHCSSCRRVLYVQPPSPDIPFP